MFAPGTNILSTLPNNDYGSKNGTSSAAPFVTGAAGLALAKNSTLTTTQLKAYIRLYRDSVSSLSNLCVTGGRLNLYKIINAVPVPHSHSYHSSHVWIIGNLAQHRSFCECGQSKLSGHVVSSSDNGWPYKTCIQCGGPANIGFVIEGFSSFAFASNSLSIEKYFGQGSYVLSNGVIVLSEQDTESYLSGLLLLSDIYDYNDCFESVSHQSHTLIICY